MTDLVNARMATYSQQTLDPGSIKQSHLKDAAQHFEAMLLEEMLKPLKQGAVSDGKDEDVSLNDSVMSDYGIEAMAGALAKVGGFGFAKKMLEQMKSEGSGSDKKTVDALK